MKLVKKNISKASGASVSVKNIDVRNALSHELRTPLAVIQGYADLLKEELEGDKDHLLQPIIESAGRLTSVIDNILEYESAPEDQRSDAMSCSVLDVVQNAVQRLSSSAQEKGIKMQLEIKGSDWKAITHEHHLDKAVIRLLDNAIKFTQAGSVRIVLDSTAVSFSITIEDSGVGIGSSSVDLFAPFAQGSSGLSREFSGLGLGLHLVQRAANMMGGTVSLADRPEGGARAQLKIARNLTSEFRKAA